MLVRRGDWATLIGRALELKHAGLGQRPIAAAVGVPRSTVRGWLSRFAAVADSAQWLHRLRVHGVDLLDVPGVADFLAMLHARFDHLDIVVNNSGIYQFARIEETTE